MKNWISFENYESAEIEQISEPVPSHHLNRFYMFNDLVADLEVDRKIHCDLGEGGKEKKSRVPS